MDFQTPVFVTQPSLPPLDEFTESLREIWDSKCLTNNGPFHQKLETALAEYLDVPYVSLFCNGTMALQVGLQALRVTGEVITTPYSFPATTHAIYWNHCTPVFCDVDRDTCNISPALIEALITPRTTCIMPVHVYGVPCDVQQIQRIADTYGLKILYDAAHTFRGQVDGASLYRHGDLSMLSFHATKVFNTIEGGALLTDDPKLKQRIDYLKNFGFADETVVVAPGSNGKMNELQAAYGLLQLKHIDAEIVKRERIDRCYRKHLQDAPGIRPLAVPVQHCAFFPIFVDEDAFGQSRDALYFALKEKGIHGRRYFYPLISDYPSYRGLPSAAASALPIATSISSKVICLPMYGDLPQPVVERICELIQRWGRANA
ncbi:MAG: DegT/DnrJ/EryC1/StrS family aminotransferase [Verrucomicrobia bacterium]|jgi:dTDP-4-amino-4,6-dideoxygalactose transaminase|nr:DegT/DnrJ/EryC1/StrS family aminotransferase [Verrucomicrobiota bacterium]